MSHFTVLVIGENPEKQLAPYHEYESTGVMDQYVEFVSVKKTKEDLEKEYEEYNKNHIFGYDSFEEFITEYYGYIVKNGIIGRYTNSNKKWDWYVLGGRWSDFFILKNGERANQALKKDIDFEAIIKEKEERALSFYEGFEKLCEGNIPKLEKTWKQCLEDNENVQDARKEYNNLPSMIKYNSFLEKEMSKNKNSDYFFSTLSEFQISKEQYVEEARQSAYVTFAIVKDSKWHGRGSMGWFAMVSDEKEYEEWVEEFNGLVSSVPEDTLLSLYDCHI